MDIQTVLSESDIIDKIGHEEAFSAQIDSHAFETKIERYVPCIGTAFDEVFEGKGYQAVFMKENHPDSLCIPWK